jgi:hypothetical protein
MTLATMNWNMGWVQYGYLILLVIKCLPKRPFIDNARETAAFIDKFPWVAQVVPVLMTFVGFAILYLGGCFSHTYNWMVWFIIMHTLLRALLIRSDKDFVSKVRSQIQILDGETYSPSKILYQHFTKLILLFLAGFFTHSLPIPLF